MISIPHNYLMAQDHAGSSPAIFAKLLEPTSNLVLWERNPVTDLNSELKKYLAKVRRADVNATRENVPLIVPFNNGEELIFPIPKAIAIAGHECLISAISDIGNAVIDNVGLPVTFYPETHKGQGLSSLRYQSSEQYTNRPGGPDDYFHLDGAYNVPIFAPDTPDQPSIPFTVICTFLGSTTHSLKATFIAPMLEAYRQKQLLQEKPSAFMWSHAATEATQHVKEPISRSFGLCNVGIMVQMPLDEQSRNLLQDSNARVRGFHKAPPQEEDDGTRLTVVLRGHAGGFTPG